MNLDIQNNQIFNDIAVWKKYHYIPDRVLNNFYLTIKQTIEEILTQKEITWCDLGIGAGYITLPLFKMLKNWGKKINFYGVDRQNLYLDYVEREQFNENIEIELHNLDITKKIPSELLARFQIISAFVFFHWLGTNKQIIEYSIKNIKKMLMRKGILFVIYPKDEIGSFVLEQDIEREHFSELERIQKHDHALIRKTLSSSLQLDKKIYICNSEIFENTLRKNGFKKYSESIEQWDYQITINEYIDMVNSGAMSRFQIFDIDRNKISIDTNNAKEKFQNKLNEPICFKMKLCLSAYIYNSEILKEMRPENEIRNKR